MTFYVNSKKKSAPKEIAQGIAACISRHKTAWEEIVLLCIGSDRITGDCLGPYVGHQLSDYVLEGLTVYGTIHRPVEIRLPLYIVSADFSLLFRNQSGT